ncbi:MAG: YggS family pyridoxal phosphate-dependent enzyme, partial [Bdellovibrionota bacterium]
ELRDKAKDFPEARWHFIGHLQTNKVKYVVGKATLVHSVDSEKILEALSERAEREKLVQDVLLELNLSGDKTKTGAPESLLPQLAAKAGALPGVRLKGLMTMGPASASEKDTRAAFRRLKELSASLTLSPQIAPELSMGMSGDFEIAIEEGATLVRIGTAIFGERPPG